MAASRMLTIAALVMLAGPALAQTPQQPIFNGHSTTDMTAVTTTPLDLRQIPLAASGSPSSENWEKLPGDVIVRNTTQPSLYPLQPKPGSANGAAIILAPGGGFMVQSIGSEGLSSAKYFTDRGFTCFILKYRLNPTPKDPRFLAADMAKMLAAGAKSGDHGLPPSAASTLAGSDGLAAVAYVRRHAKEFGVDPHRIGFVGFSAGGAVAMTVATTYDASSRPDFVGVIYGPSPLNPVPSDAPPLFAAVAADDPLLGHASFTSFETWRAAGKSAELHVYAEGGHGFGGKTQGTTSDLWLAEFVGWIKFLRFGAGTPS